MLIRSASLQLFLRPLLITFELPAQFPSLLTGRQSWKGYSRDAVGPSCPANSIWKGLYQHSSTEGMGISWKVWGEGWETTKQNCIDFGHPVAEKSYFSKPD